MKKLTLLIIVIVCTSFKIHNPVPRETFLTIKQEIESTKTGYHDRKLVCVYQYSDKYDIPPVILHNLIMAESSYRHWVKNRYTGALGLGQILPKWWTHILYHIDDGELGNHIKNKNIKHTDRYFLRIGYNIEASALILRHFRDTQGDFSNALRVYGGFRSKGASEAKYGRYVRSILPTSQ
jgi:hypothetical protein